MAMTTHEKMAHNYKILSKVKYKLLQYNSFAGTDQNHPAR